MSGICGWHSVNAPIDEPINGLLEMQKPLLKEPYSVQKEISATASIASVTRLQQGQSLREANILLTYEGRIRFLDSELNDIAQKQSPGQALILAYQKTGTDMLQLFTGPFSLAIIDLDKNTTLLAIDRIGVNQLSFTQNKNSCIFASTVESVAAHPDVSVSIDTQSIFNYLYFHMVPSPRAIYEGIEKLLPGQYALLENNTVKKQFYWKQEYKPSSNSIDELASECMQVMQNAVARQSTTNTTGAFLSGGTDSSTVSGLLTQYLGHGAKTFSIGFDAEGFDETEFANITVKHFNTQHQGYRVTPDDVADTIPLIAKSYDEPFGNASAVPTYFCAKMAKENGIDIMLAGDGGDEIFAGNERYSKQQVFEHYYAVPGIIRQFLKPLIVNMPGMDAITLTRKIKSYVQQASIPLPDRLETYNFLQQTPLNEIFSSDFLASINSEEPLEICREAYRQTQSSSILDKMMHLDMKNTLADNDLRKVGTMCELAGIDVRYPFLDEDVVNFASTVPANLQIKDGNLRYFFKYSIRNFLANETLTKQKHGFGLPFGLWLQENTRLQTMAYDNLSSFKNRGYINPAYIDNLIKLHSGDHASYYGVMVWVIMILEEWLTIRKL